ncbi:hypothetical protein DICPUDRAFT_25815 [Dictyostelium purpureum]|uniref:Lysosomal dipeptide transporter MFSD1 n=1 Tax=Dictyostelium purpureum TaxID=5786 RepID=F0Z7M5_DICPU|nr:uncharacterized protein DICPUDRAFT_25815 [Dictyostelium purpureum]EGC40040.1 hypothetical protein DICPUDRAFT_25815 [Dictyostelium purpureum]|eukprot:XP_003283389.1 hypothetical protein DICPUDRAFT_25815 [Dictyostelium purpureum]
MVFIGGILIDIVGTNIISVIFCGLALLSSFVTVISTPHYKGLMVGRFLLGSGGETLLSCAATMIPLWFSAKEVPLCMGFFASWVYWGNLTALIILPRINEVAGFRAAMWFIFGVFVLEFVLNLLLIRFKEKLSWTVKGENGELKNIASLQNMNLISRTSSTADILDSEGRELNNEDDQSTAPTFSSNDSTPIESTTPLSSDEMMLEDGMIINEIKSDINNPQLSKYRLFVIKIKEIKEQAVLLPKRFWLLSIICFIGYYTMFGLAIIGTDVLKSKFDYNEKTSANYMASEAMVNGILPVFTGLLIQNIRGRKIQIMAFASFLLGLGVLLLNITDVNPLPWIIICGVGFSLLNTTLFSCIPLLVDMSIVGTAYGIVTTAYNCNIIIFPPILDAIKEHTGSYTIPLYFLSFTSVITISLLGLLKYWDTQVPLSQSLDSPLTTINLNVINENNNSIELKDDENLIKNQNNEETIDNLNENENNSILV